MSHIDVFEEKWRAVTLWLRHNGYHDRMKDVLPLAVAMSRPAPPYVPRPGNPLAKCVLCNGTFYKKSLTGVVTAANLLRHAVCYTCIAGRPHILPLEGGRVTIAPSCSLCSVVLSIRAEGRLLYKGSHHALCGPCYAATPVHIPDLERVD